jgi:hypothetical protein
VSKTVVSDDTLTSTKQSESVDISHSTITVNNIESPSNKNRSGQNVNLTTQTEFDSDSLKNNCTGEKSKELWGENIAEDQPMLQKSLGSGEKKQEIFMHSLNLCKQKGFTPSLPQSSRKMESRSARKKSLLLKQQDDSLPGRILPPPPSFS